MPASLSLNLSVNSHRRFKDLALVVDESLLAETVRGDLQKIAWRVLDNRFDLESGIGIRCLQGRGRA